MYRWEFPNVIIKRFDSSTIKMPTSPMFSCWSNFMYDIVHSVSEIRSHIFRSNVQVTFELYSQSSFISKQNYIY